MFSEPWQQQAPSLGGGVVVPSVLKVWESSRLYLCKEKQVKQQNDWSNGFTNVTHLHGKWCFCDSAPLVQPATHGRSVLVTEYWAWDVSSELGNLKMLSFLVKANNIYDLF